VVDVGEDGGIVVGVVTGMIAEMIVGDVIGDGMADLELRVVAGLGGGEVVVFLWRALVVVVGFRGWKWRWISMMEFW